MRTSASVSMKSLMSISRRSGSSARIRMPSRMMTGRGVNGSARTWREYVEWSYVRWGTGRPAFRSRRSWMRSGVSKASG
jgi:hypothetical protein